MICGFLGLLLVKLFGGSKLKEEKDRMVFFHATDGKHSKLFYCIITVRVLDQINLIYIVGSLLNNLNFWIKLIA